MKKVLSKISILVLFVFVVQSKSNAQTGTWTALTNQSPAAGGGNMGVMVLMTDGTVLCHNESGGTDGTGWDKLTPDATGSYINGTWSTIASMHNDRLFFSSQVLPSGKLYVAGGEYGAGTSKGEVYDPVANTWTNCGAIPSGWKIYDAPSELLYNGLVLEGTEIGANGGQPCNSVETWNPTTTNYTTITASPLNHDEAAWVKLPDSTVLYIGMPLDAPSQQSVRYAPKTGTWFNDAAVPNQIYDTYGEESGCALQLPNGKDIFFGSTQYNEIYTPSGHSNTAGTWSNATNMPTISGNVVGQVDAPGAMMVNGHILLAVSPGNKSTSLQFLAPVWFVEYNYLPSPGTFTQVTSNIPGVGMDSIQGEISNFITFLDLPDGNVLMGIEQAGITQYWEYTPGTGPIAAGKPTINSIIRDACPDYKITGKLFNGISEGASFGDDWQMSTNYPLVRFLKGTNVYYAKTTNWNRVGAVATDSLEDTCVFSTPAGLAAGTTYSVEVVVNGFVSNTTLFTTLGITSVVDTNPLCYGDSGSATVNVVGSFSPYTYAWSGGGTKAEKTGLTAGTCTITVTDNNGCSVSATTTITQPTKLVVTIAKTNVGCNGGSNGSDTAKASGGITPYTYLWNGGSTTKVNSGLTAGSYTVTVTDNKGCMASATTTITQPTTTNVSVTTSVTTDIICKGESMGVVKATASHGTTPYTYLWSPSTETNASASNLSAGTYTITVTDNGGCTATATITLTQPATGVSVTANVATNVTCNDGSNGSVSSTPSGGITPYTYAWTGGGTNSTKSGLSTGTYTITVTDNKGCYSSTSVIVSNPAAISISTYSVAADPGGCDGIAAAIVMSGGTAPYTYKWSPGDQTTDTIKAQCKGTYCCVVIDHNGCFDSTCVIIGQSDLGVAIINNASNINIYPDPNTGSFTVAGVIQGQIIEVYNNLGQNLSSVTADKATMYFDISNKADGIYLIRILNKDGSVVTQKKIVKAQ